MWNENVFRGLETLQNKVCFNFHIPFSVCQMLSKNRAVVVVFLFFAFFGRMFPIKTRWYEIREYCINYVWAWRCVDRADSQRSQATAGKIEINLWTTNALLARTHTCTRHVYTNKIHTVVCMHWHGFYVCGVCCVRWRFGVCVRVTLKWTRRNETTYKNMAAAIYETETYEFIRSQVTH